MRELNREEKSHSFKQRFEFLLKINNNIICQRYFDILNFNQSSLDSVDLYEAISLCTQWIDEDLVAKSRIHAWYAAPLIFNTEDEMNTWLENPRNITLDERFKKVGLLQFGRLIVVKNSDKEFYWNGEKAVSSPKKWDGGEYARGLPEDGEIMFSLTFRDKGVDIITKCWDGKHYPKLVRSNIDLSNDYKKYGEDGNTFENAVLAAMFKREKDENGRFCRGEKRDLVYEIISLLQEVCAYKDPQTTYLGAKLSVGNEYRRANVKQY